MKIIISEKQLKYLISEQITDSFGSCKSEYENALIKSKEFWKNWLNDPITKQKMTSIHNFKSEEKTNKIIQKYISAIDKINLSFFDSVKKTNDGQINLNDEDLEYFYTEHSYNYAFVGVDPKIIYVNCANDTTDKIGVLVHEIQHVLYDIFPINPKKKIGNAFVKKGDRIGSYIDILSSQFRDYKKTGDQDKIRMTGDQIKNLKLNLDKLGVKDVTEINNLIQRYNKIIIANSEPKYGYYGCNLNEKMSNIFTMRSLFNLKPSDKITLNLLKPYILFEKTNDGISYILLCWAFNGFKDIEDFINDMNLLALKNQKSGDNQIT